MKAAHFLAGKCCIFPKQYKEWSLAHYIVFGAIYI